MEKTSGARMGQSQSGDSIDRAKIEPSAAMMRTVYIGSCRHISTRPLTALDGFQEQRVPTKSSSCYRHPTPPMRTVRMDIS